MKRIFKYLGFLTILLALITCLPQNAIARTLVIPQWLVDAKLHQNGDLAIVEDITFDFSGEFNGVYRQIGLEKTSGVEDIQVYELQGTTQAYTQVEAAKNGDVKVFSLEEENNNVLVRIFSPSEDEAKTFRVSYTLRNVATKYNDIGEVYYKFLGSDNDTPIGRFKVNVFLPQADNTYQVKVFAHGPLNGKINKENSTTYSLYVEDVLAGTFIEGRVLFPRDLIPLSNNVQDKDNLNNILAEEAAQQNKSKHDEARKKQINNLLGQASILVSGISLGLVVILRNRFKRQENIYQSGSYGSNVIPEDCTPAVAAYLTGTIVDTNTIFATILDLIRKGYLRLSKGKDLGDKAAEEEFVISQIKQVDESLISHEKHFIDWFINIMGNGSFVSTKEIASFNKNNSAKYIDLHTNWKKKIKEDAHQKGYYDLSTTKYGVGFFLLSIVLVMIGMLALIYSNLLGIVSLVSAVLIFIYSITLFNRHSDYGNQQYKGWVLFRKNMRKNINGLYLEELYKAPADISLIYALSLGIDNKIDGIDLGHADYAYSYDSWFIWYLLFMQNNNSTLHKSFNTSLQGPSGNDSFSGGGFTGGGGGGAGGGGAGGF